MAGVSPLYDDQMLAMLESGFAGREELRDKAIFALGCSTGFRIQEILDFRVNDILSADGSIKRKIYAYHTKGKQSRSVVLTEDFAEPFIRLWIEQRQRRGFMRANSYLFIKSNGYPLYYQAYRKTFLQACERCGLIDDRYCTHSMRKTFARNTYKYWENQRKNSNELIDPLIKTQIALGHKNLNATRSYLAFMFGGADESTRSLYSHLDFSSAINQAQKK